MSSRPTSRNSPVGCLDMLFSEGLGDRVRGACAIGVCGKSVSQGVLGWLGWQAWGSVAIGVSPGIAANRLCAFDAPWSAVRNRGRPRESADLRARRGVAEWSGRLRQRAGFMTVCVAKRSGRLRTVASLGRASS